ncbi:hypothetical protein OG689_06970 [Kitasatospora sp. NBC_00240]|uniref:hypothetical protein n=1 Tax=Kitasatospora sp. NBC_00240 TaxID=2903567 RepID=UPI002255C51D|nr:hypothetical protein [Kitasatospora sp. NBC_00240]MCX5209034.1 hypothetical protein [Kitasatospora sp. NBC_00240]
MTPRAVLAAPIVLVLALLGAGCTGKDTATPVADPAASRTTADSAPAATTPTAAPSGSAPAWREAAALSAEQLTAALLPGTELPAGSTTEPYSTAHDAATTTLYETAAKAYPACAPVLAVLSETPSARAGVLYVTGNNVLGNRTAVDLASFPPGRVRERFDALKAAVHGGCTQFRVRSDGPTFTVRSAAADVAGIPAVAFTCTTPTGAVTSPGGITRTVLYAAAGDNRLLFALTDDTALHPVLRADLVNAQVNRFLAATGSPVPSAPAAG